MALPSTPETVHILNRERIALLPADACVINVGRGTALDQKALAEALNSGKLAGAALDVMDPEPLPEGHPLWTTPGVLFTPHVGGASSAMHPRIAALVRRQIDHLLAGEEPENIVIRT